MTNEEGLAYYCETVPMPKRRRHKASPGECPFCDRERARGNMTHPSHDASDRCESGKRPHCTCDTCW
jgi:hypothetical protein